MVLMNHCICDKNKLYNVEKIENAMAGTKENGPEISAMNFNCPNCSASGLEYSKCNGYCLNKEEESDEEKVNNNNCSYINGTIIHAGYCCGCGKQNKPEEEADEEGNFPKDKNNIDNEHWNWDAVFGCTECKRCNLSNKNGISLDYNARIKRRDQIMETNYENMSFINNMQFYENLRFDRNNVFEEKIHENIVGEEDRKIEVSSLEHYNQNGGSQSDHSNDNGNDGQCLTVDEMTVASNGTNNANNMNSIVNIQVQDERRQSLLIESSGNFLHSSNDDDDSGGGDASDETESAKQEQPAEYGSNQQQQHYSETNSQKENGCNVKQGSLPNNNSNDNCGTNHLNKSTATLINDCDANSDRHYNSISVPIQANHMDDEDFSNIRTGISNHHHHDHQWSNNVENTNRILYNNNSLNHEECSNSNNNNNTDRVDERMEKSFFVHKSAKCNDSFINGKMNSVNSSGSITNLIKHRMRPKYKFHCYGSILLPKWNSINDIATEGLFLNLNNENLLKNEFIQTKSNNLTNEQEQCFYKINKFHSDGFLNCGNDIEIS